MMQCSRIRSESKQRKYKNGLLFPFHIYRLISVLPDSFDQGRCSCSVGDAVEAVVAI